MNTFFLQHSYSPCAPRIPYLVEHPPPPPSAPNPIALGSTHLCVISKSGRQGIQQRLHHLPGLCQIDQQIVRHRYEGVLCI